MTHHSVGTRDQRSAAAPSRTTIVLLGVSALAWAVTVGRMWGMDDGPGTDLGGLGWYLGIWVTMTAAMMLPSAVRVAPSLVYAAEYLAVWIAYGVLAYALYRFATSFDTGWLAWDAGGPYVAGGPSSRRECTS